MSERITDIIGDQIAASVLDTVNKSNVLFPSGPRRYHSKPWQPPVYTSMAWWLFLNYSLLILLGVLFGAVAYGITKML